MNIRVTMVFKDEGGSRHERVLELEAPSIGDILGNVEVYIESLYARHNWELKNLMMRGEGKGDKNETQAAHS